MKGVRLLGGSHQGATGQFSGFMGGASQWRRQPRPRGIAVSRSCILIVDGGDAADTPTSLHVADLKSARRQAAAAARGRRLGKTVGRITVQDGDGLAGANEAMLQARQYVCNNEGSRATAVEVKPGGVLPS